LTPIEQIATMERLFDDALTEINCITVKEINCITVKENLHNDN